MLLVLDTTYLRESHYHQFWRRASRQLNESDSWGNTLNVLSINGTETAALAESLNSMASSHIDGFTVSELCKSIQERRSATGTGPMPSAYRPDDTGDGKPLDIIILPLVRPKLKLYEHFVFSDPHDKYLKDCDSNLEEVHKDGACEVVKLRMGPDVQEFSSSLGLSDSVSDS